MIDNFLKNLAKHHRAILQTHETTWYNGHAYMPLFIHTLIIHDTDATVQFKYEYRKSEFSRSTAVDGGAFGDRHIFEFIATYTKSEISSFEVAESGFFTRLFSRQKSLFNVKSESDSLRKSLENNRHLTEIMQFLNIDPEFSPTISGGRNSKGIYCVEMKFLTKYVQELLIDKSFKFLISFAKL